MTQNRGLLVHPMNATLDVASMNFCFLKSCKGFFNLAQVAAGTPFFFLAEPKTYSISSINMIDGWKCLATAKAIYNVFPIDALSVHLPAILDGVKSKVIALHSVASALNANVLPEPGGPKNKK